VSSLFSRPTGFARDEREREKKREHAELNERVLKMSTKLTTHYNNNSFSSFFSPLHYYHHLLYYHRMHSK